MITDALGYIENNHNDTFIMYDAVDIDNSYLPLTASEKGRTAVELTHKKESESKYNSKYWQETAFCDLTEWSSIKELVIQEANLICSETDGDPKDGYIMIAAESRFQAAAKNINGHLNVDSGPAQLNNGGSPLLGSLGKTLTLGNGEKIKVTWKNYKTNPRLNIHIGLRYYYDYLKRCNGDSFAAYAMYNAGESYEKYVKNANGALEVIAIMRARGNNQAANNIKNNFAIQYNKYKNIDLYSNEAR